MNTTTPGRRIFFRGLILLTGSVGDDGSMESVGGLLDARHEGWYIDDNGVRHGPFSDQEIAQRVRSGTLTPTDLVWRKGYLEWKRAQDVPGLFSPPPIEDSCVTNDSSTQRVSQGVAHQPTTIIHKTSPGPDARVSYFVRHWRGDLSLPKSYWVNGVLATIVVMAALTVASPLIDPTRSTVGAAIGLSLVWLFVCAVGVWQLVGIWRSAGKHKTFGGSGFWANVARAMVVFGWLNLINVVMNQAYPQVREFWRIAEGDPAMGAHRLRILRDGTELEYAGGITFGATDEVRKMLDAAPSVRVIHLNSNGGRIAEARQLRDLIRDRGLVTYTSQVCASACTIAFMGGIERYIAPDAKLGFHRGSFPGVSEQDLALENDAARKDLLAEAVPPWFVDKAYSTSSESMWWPSPDELRRANVVTALAAPTDFAISGVAAATTPQRVDDILAKYPLYVSIKNAEPETYAKIRDAVLDAFKMGKSEAELSAITRPYFSTLEKKYLAVASGEAIVEMTRVVVAELDQTGAQSADACYNLLHQRADSPPVIITQYVSPEIVQRDLAAADAVIESGAVNPQRIPSEKEVSRALDLVMRRLIKKHSAADVLAITTDSPDVDHGKVCEVTSALYKEVLALPTKDQINLLRYLYASK